jgi:hypothetical protein
VATRALERGPPERHLVERAAVLATDATGLLARTTAHRQPWPERPFPPPPDRSRPTEGRLRIGTEADTVLRVRYAPGSEVRDGADGLLVDGPPPPARVEVTAAAGRVGLRTPAMTAVATETFGIGPGELGETFLRAGQDRPGPRPVDLGRRGRPHPALLQAGRDWVRLRYRLLPDALFEAAQGLDTMPLYLREGAVVPMGPVTRWVGERPTDPLTVVVAPFEDDGRTELAVPVDGREVTVRYQARAGRHRVEVEGHPGQVVLDAPADVELGT